MKDVSGLLQFALESSRYRSSDEYSDLSPNIRSELHELRDFKSDVLRMQKNKNVRDLLYDFSLDATRQLIIEMKTASRSSDRIRAATELMDRAQGKPIQSMVTLDMKIHSMSDKELDAEIQRLVENFGYKEQKANQQSFVLPKLKD